MDVRHVYYFGRKVIIYVDQAQNASIDTCKTATDPPILQLPAMPWPSQWSCLQMNVLTELLRTLPKNTAMDDTKHCNVAPGAKRCQVEFHQCVLLRYVDLSQKT